jgi:uncharacterized membrane protein YbaN (DUF454 family)
MIFPGGGVAAQNFKRIFVLVLGWALIGFGVLGLFVPILQGVLFIILGLLVLSRESRAARGLLAKLEKRFPNAHAKARAMKESMRSKFRGGRQHGR